MHERYWEYSMPLLSYSFYELLFQWQVSNTIIVSVRYLHAYCYPHAGLWAILHVHDVHDAITVVAEENLIYGYIK